LYFSRDGFFAMPGKRKPRFLYQGSRSAMEIHGAFSDESSADIIIATYTEQKKGNESQ